MSPPDFIPTLPGLVAAGLLDAELAALTWLLLEDGVPVHVAGPEPDGRDVLLDALVAALPTDRRPDAATPDGGRRLVRVEGTLTGRSPAGLLRAALARTTGRSGLASTIEAHELAEVLAVLRGQGLSDDEISFLGCVLIVAATDGPGGATGRHSGRVEAAHYLRPLARDAGGHVQRLAPAVLATWDHERAAYDHFGWAIFPELAARTGRRAGDLEREQLARVERLGATSPESPS